MSIVVTLGDVCGEVPIYGSPIGLNSLDIGNALEFSVDQSMYIKCTGLKHIATGVIIPMVPTEAVPDTTVVPRSDMSQLRARDEYELQIHGNS
jgi:hypothetical protein